MFFDEFMSLSILYVLHVKCVLLESSADKLTEYVFCKSGVFCIDIKNNNFLLKIS